MAFLYDIMGNNLVKSAAVDFGIQWVLWVVASKLQTEKFYDLAGSGTFLLLAYQSLKWNPAPSDRQKIQSGMVMTWALRLGLFLFTRILKEGSDRRFNNVRDNPKKFLIYWTLQGVWVLVTILPTLILNNKENDRRPISNRDYIGWSLWIVGFLLEITADWQKARFRNNPDNAGKFIQNGLWSISRHPNYFGEILLWTGLYISASSVMKGKEYLSVISPIFTTLLLTKLSGIPMLEKSAARRWGSNPDYQSYVKNTAVLIPFLW